MSLRGYLSLEGIGQNLFAKTGKGEPGGSGLGCWLPLQQIDAEKRTGLGRGFQSALGVARHEKSRWTASVCPEPKSITTEFRGSIVPRIVLFYPRIYPKTSKQFTQETVVASHCKTRTCNYPQGDPKHPRRTREKRRFLKPAAQNPAHFRPILSLTPISNASLTPGRRCRMLSALESWP
jgi:hypothetical protein